MRLDGRAGIVTGAARGIGFATAQRLVEAGAIVAIWDKDSAAADDAVGRLAGHDGDVFALDVDVTRPDSIAAGLRDTLNRCAGIDILVNNAGIVGRTRPITELSDDDWEEVVRADLTSVSPVFPSLPA